MELGGYMGKMLYVDLTTREIREESLDFNMARKYIGDFGFGARLAYDLMKPGVDPLSPENYIIIGAGPLVGTSCPATSRCHAWTKYPITNTIGPGSGSMGFACSLKYAGYDQVIITGRADRPVYLKISDEGIEIRDAADLWGKNIFEATDEMWRRHGDDYGVICIGQAGENLVKISLALVDKEATIGRHGLGAVMGSKNLKLITAGGKKTVKVADPARFAGITDQVMREVMRWPILDEYVELGHLEYDFDAITRNTVKNYYSEMVDQASAREKFGPEMYLTRMKKGRIGCTTCPVACHDIYELKRGPNAGLQSFQTHTTYYIGEAFDLDDIEQVTEVAHLCQIYGIDEFTFVRSSEFLLDLHKRGIISDEELEGFGSGYAKGVPKLVEKTAFREGIGAALADGLKGIVGRFGPEAEKYGNYIKGADPYFDGRPVRLGIMYLELIVSPHFFGAPKGGMLNPGKFVIAVGEDIFRQYGRWISIPERDMDRLFDTPLRVNVARFLRHSQDFYAAFSMLGVCIRLHMHQYFGMERLAELYSAATGLEIDAAELKRAAEKSWNILKALNMREGLSRKDDRFPRKWLEPLKRGDEEIPLKDILGVKDLTAADLEQMLDDYYDEREWDKETGCPTAEKLEELGLADIADDLAERGIIAPRQPKGWSVEHWGVEWQLDEV